MMKDFRSKDVPLSLQKETGGEALEDTFFPTAPGVSGHREAIAKNQLEAPRSLQS